MQEGSAGRLIAGNEGTDRLEGRCLYLVLTEAYSQGRNVLEIAEEALAGGVDILQMREKARPAEELRPLGRELRALCRKSGALFIVNDDPILAADVDADGVHLGQEDLQAWPLPDVRARLGRDCIVGLSTHSLAQFRDSQALDVDYLAYGPLFPTQAKAYCLGTEEVPAVLAAASKPVFLIGGIDGTNLDSLREMGAPRIALIRDLMQAQDVKARARHYKDRLAPGGLQVQIHVNGRDVHVPAALTLEGLAGDRNCAAPGVVLERNREIVPRERWGELPVQAGDRIEFVKLVGGG